MKLWFWWGVFRMSFSRLLKIVYVVENLVAPRALGLWLRFFVPKRAPAYQPLGNSVLYVAASSLPYHISGYTVRTQSLLKAIQAAGLSITVQTRPGYPWDRADGLVKANNNKSQIEGITYQSARKPTRYRPIVAYTLQGAAVIAAAAKEQRAAVVHAASNYANALPALFAARRLGVPFHYEMRGLWELSRASKQKNFENSAGFRLGLTLEGFVARNADRLYVISDTLGLYAQQHWGVDPKKIYLLPNCIDPDTVQPCNAYDMEPGTIGYAGSLIGYEGLDTLLDALALLNKQGKRFKLLIVGDGEERPKLEAQMYALGLEASVKFLGRVQPDKAKALLSSCALVVIPRKPYAVCKIVPPLKLVEALALGKALVVPDLQVFRDELGQDAPAFFFESGDAKDLARVIDKALADMPAILAVGQRARQYAVNHRNWGRFVSLFT